MATTDIFPPAVEPISLEKAKDFLRVDHTQDEGIIEGFIGSARQHVEDRLQSVLIERPRRFIGSDISTANIRLVDSPIKSLSAVTLLGAAGERLVIALEDVQLILSSRLACVSLKRGTPWASILGNITAIEIDYVAGYGPSEDDTPLPIRQAILLLIGYFYQYRGDDNAPSYPMMLDDVGRASFAGHDEF